MTASEFPISKLLIELEKNSLLPAIVFRTSRKQCDLDIQKLSETQYAFMSEKEQIAVKNSIEQVIKKYSLDRDIIEKHPHFQSLISTGCGAHHAGQLLIWRLLLEELMGSGVLRILVATGTVAAGVDFPARTVVITAHSKRKSDGFYPLSPSELQQMSGRAGRRGKDKVGFCIVAPGPFCDARVIYKIAKLPPEPLRSAYFPSPSTVLNLLKYRTTDELKIVVNKSLAAFHDKKSAEGLLEEAKKLQNFIDQERGTLSPTQIKKLEKKVKRTKKSADALKTKQIKQLNLALEGLTALNFIDNNKLTDKGIWAAELCTNLVLYLAEAIDQGLFYNKTVEEVTALTASISGDPHRNYFTLGRINIDQKLFKELDQIIRKINLIYKGPQSIEEIAVQQDAALTSILWMQSPSWDNFASYLRLDKVAEGDAARLIMQTAENLNQLSRLTNTHPELAHTSAMAKSLLLKPPITEGFMID